MGVAEDEIESYLHGDDEDEGDPDEVDPYEVFPENWDAVRVFQALTSQWRRDSFTGIFEGLNYPSVESVLHMMKIENTADVFRDIRVMEFAARKELNRGR
jgi:hypothetical protein